MVGEATSARAPLWLVQSVRVVKLGEGLGDRFEPQRPHSPRDLFTTPQPIPHEIIVVALTIEGQRDLGEGFRPGRVMRGKRAVMSNPDHPGRLLEATHSAGHDLHKSIRHGGEITR
jgi:hypothetical protein